MADDRKHIITIKYGVFKLDNIQSGQLQFWRNRAYLGCPKCGTVMALDHDVEVSGEANEKVTIKPSVICTCNAHFLVTDGKIRWV
jgi:hypothetical protein